MRLLASEVAEPVNLGTETEVTMAELAETVIALTGARSGIARRPLPADDPARRRPDLSRAREALGWAPAVGLREGLGRTIEWFEAALSDRAPHAPAAG